MLISLTVVRPSCSGVTLAGAYIQVQGKKTFPWCYCRKAKRPSYCTKIQQKMSRQRQEESNKLKAQFKHYQRERKTLLNDGARNITFHENPTGRFSSNEYFICVAGT